MRSVTLLDATTSTGLGTYKRLGRGRWKLQMTLADTNASESVAVHVRQDASSDDEVLAKGGSALALTQTDNSFEIASGGESYAGNVSDGSEAVTLIATYIGP